MYVCPDVVSGARHLVLTALLLLKTKIAVLSGERLPALSAALSDSEDEGTTIFRKV
jgi:hypothetical protein